jgi:hypothetical protein
LQKLSSTHAPVQFVFKLARKNQLRLITILSMGIILLSETQTREPPVQAGENAKQ